MRIFLFPWLVLVAVYFGYDLGSVSAQCGSDQKSLLLELKNGLSFNSSLSTKLITWNSSVDAFAGVVCEAGHVIDLDLSEETLSRGINSSSGLFRLQYLQRLNLAYNRFQNSGIPPGFSNLSDLVYLNLSNAGFEGQVPMELSYLTRLVILDLSSLSVLGMPQLKLENPNLKMLVGNFKELRELYLDGVAVSARGDEWCRALSSSLPKLEVLSMVNCNLSGPIDGSLLNLSSLSVIRLTGNNLSTTVPQFLANFTNLTDLRLDSCGLRGVLPAKIFQNPTLQTLDVSNNKVLGGSLPEFPWDSSLQKVVLSKTNMVGRLPYSMGRLRNLQRIEFENCGFTGLIPTSVANLSRLTHLDLSQNNLNGPIPPFSLLRNLTEIILSHNNLTREISSTSWGDLRMLENVDMRNNSFKGTIPLSLFTLPRIKKIQLSNNQFSGQLIGSSNAFPYNLNTLDLSSNSLQGAIPNWVFLLTGMKRLSLSANNFSGSLHITQFQMLKNLSYLDLSYNRLSINTTGATAALNSGFPQLTTFRVASCGLRSVPEFLATQTKLNFLDLSDNQIQGKIPKWMWTFHSILYLNLSANKLNEMESPPSLLTSSVQVLDLHSNQLQGKFLPIPPAAAYLDYSDNNFSLEIREDIGSLLPFTIYVSLARNRFHGVIPMTICNATFLEVLDLSNNSLEGAIPECMMDSLKILNLQLNRLTGSIPSNIKKTCGLKTLAVNSNQLEGGLPWSLQSCSMLEVLDIGNNKIRDKFPYQLKNISSLRVLVLRSNEFYGEISCPNKNDTWKMLQIVDLSRNNFSGEIPGKCLMNWEAMSRSGTDLSHLQYPILQLSGMYYQDAVLMTIKGLELELVKILTIFTSIDFSCNSFKGPIPDTLGDLRALLILNMSHNMLSGPIPSSMGNLQQLESLDLSSNKLNGKIPETLSNLNFLAVLNLSYNQLVGKIPANKQFKTFPNSSFEGNTGLCGLPMTKTCSNPNATAPANPKHKQNSTDKSFNWQFIVAGLGFGAGAAAVIALLTFCDWGRTCCDDHVDRILLVFLPMIGLRYHRQNTNGEDNSEDRCSSGSDFRGRNTYDHEDSDEELEQGEEEMPERYCVLCTKLDLNMKMAFHDPKCTCYDTPPISPSYNPSCSSSPAEFASPSHTSMSRSMYRACQSIHENEQ